MKRFHRILAALLAILLIGAGAATGFGEGAALALPQLDDCFTERDLSGAWDATATDILLTGDTAETSSHVVDIDGGTATILDGGVYELSGTLSDGCIIVDVKDDERVQLVLNGVSITASSGAAIRVLQADKVFITLAEGTENALTSLAFDEGDSVDAVIYSDEDLTFNGTGTLVVESTAGSGIDGKDDVKFASGTYVITAAGRGIDANDSVRIADGDFTITTDGDAIRCRHENNAELGYIYIWGGTFNITTGGGAGEAVAQAGDFGMMAGGMPQGEMPEFAEGQIPEMSDGEMPTPPEGFAEGEMPDFADGEMPTPPEGFTEGEMPTPPEGMEMPATESTAEADEDAVSAKGFKASGDIVILGGTFVLDTADDAFHADGDLLVFDGDLTIASSDDGLHADGALTIMSGTVNITQSSEGLEAEVIAIMGGDIAVTASDDGLNARDSGGEKETFDAQEGVSIDISGGTLYVNASGDGIDSNGDLNISGGTVVVSGPTVGANGALDYNGTATVSGGTVIAAGISGMAENFSDSSTQAAFLVSLTADAGEITVTDADGNVVASATVEKGFETVVVSSPALVIGETYTVACGESSAEITLTDTITGANSGGMGGGPSQGMGSPPNGFEPPSGSGNEQASAPSPQGDTDAQSNETISD